MRLYSLLTGVCRPRCATMRLQSSSVSLVSQRQLTTGGFSLSYWGARRWLRRNLRSFYRLIHRPRPRQRTIMGNRFASGVKVFLAFQVVIVGFAYTMYDRDTLVGWSRYKKETETEAAFYRFKERLPSIWSLVPWEGDLYGKYTIGSMSFEILKAEDDDLDLEDDSIL